MSSSSSSSSTTMRWGPSSTKDFSSSLGSLMSTYGTSGSTPTPAHLKSPRSSRRSEPRRDGLSPPPPTPSQSCTSLLLCDDSRRSSLDSQTTLTSDSDMTDESEAEDMVGHLQSQYGLGSFGSGMPVPTPVVFRPSSSQRRRKSQKDKTSGSSEPVSKVGSLLSRYGFAGSSVLSRDSR